MRRFTAEEDQILRDSYLEKTPIQIGKMLNRNCGSIYGRLKHLGLITPEEVKIKRLKDGAMRLMESGKHHRYPKGHAPQNKGKKMPPELYEKCKGTMFKPGQIPATCVHFGKPYLYERYRKGRTEKLWFIQEDTDKRSAYLAYLCKQNGIKLKGMVPVLKEGFDHSRPPTMEDIEVLTRAENMRRNTYHRYPKEVAQLIQLKGVITRQINKLRKNE